MFTKFPVGQACNKKKDYTKQTSHGHGEMMRKNVVNCNQMNILSKAHIASQKIIVETHVREISQNKMAQ